MAGGYVTDCVPWEGAYGRYYWRCMARGAEGRYATLHVHIPIQMEEVSRRDKYHVPKGQTETETEGNDGNGSSSQPTVARYTCSIQAIRSHHTHNPLALSTTSRSILACTI